MKVLGIIAEYNPFHNGHLYHLNKSVEISKADFTVCVMSGNFLQRGEPALFDKWIRAETAVKNGIDLVIELPFIFSSSSAEYFSKGAINILDRLGCITHISFGNEKGEIDDLYSIAEILSYEPDSFKYHLKNNLKKGYSFPYSREISLNEVTEGLDIQNVLSTPNNILATEYLKWLIRIGSGIEPIAIKRYSADYHDLSIKNSICSATAIRELLIKNKKEYDILQNVVPSPTYETITNYAKKGISPLFKTDLWHLIQYKLMTTPSEELGEVFSASEGIENRLLNQIYNHKTLDDLISHVKTKRYPLTNVQRLLIHTLIGLSKKDMRSFEENDNLYARILGFSCKGTQLLRNIKESDSTTLPVITNINKEVSPDSPFYSLLEYDVISSDVYHLASGKYNMYNESDHVRKPYIHKE